MFLNLIARDISKKTPRVSTAVGEGFFFPTQGSRKKNKNFPGHCKVVGRGPQEHNRLLTLRRPAGFLRQKGHRTCTRISKSGCVKALGCKNLGFSQTTTQAESPFSHTLFTTARAMIHWGIFIYALPR
jgi:hypothetical protein